jgi:hypothetical protein
MKKAGNRTHPSAAARLSPESSRVWLDFDFFFLFSPCLSSPLTQDGATNLCCALVQVFVYFLDSISFHLHVIGTLNPNYI